MNNEEEAKNRLRELLKPGDKVYTVLRHVSQSGMFRRISVLKIDGKGDVYTLDGLIEITGLAKRRGRKEGLAVSGCGMDMGFHLVYELSRMLWPSGFKCAGYKKCCSNDHTNGDRNYKSHHHADGGYALKRVWL